MADDALTSLQGDALDELLWRERGLGPSALPATLTLNPGLGALGAVLPAGTIVILPPAPVPVSTVPLINLWD